MSTVAPLILFVDDYPKAQVGGGERHLLQIAGACAGWGLHAGVVCVPDSGLEREARSAGLDVYPLEIGRGSLGAHARLRRLFDELKPEIVHIHGFNAMLSASAAARHAGAGKVYVTVHNMPSAPLSLHPGPRGWLEVKARNALYRHAQKHVDLFVCVVRAAARELEEAGIDPARLTVIPNGIPDPVRAVDPSLQAKSEHVIVGSVGRLEPLKGYQYFVEAAAQVLALCPDVEFRLIGDGSLRNELTAQVIGAGIGDRFHMLGWSDDPLGEIAQMDIYVVSSVTDTTNLTVLEAMGLGKPVIATDVGGISDAVVDGENGFLVRARDVASLSGSLMRLLGNKPRCADMAVRSRRRFEQSFTVSTMLERHHALYLGL